MTATHEPLRVALIGLGAIGEVVARELLARNGPRLQLVAVMARELPPEGSLPVKVCKRLSTVLAQHPDLVIEAAGQGAVLEYGPACLRAGCDLLVASVGALADAEVLAQLEQAAQATGRQVLLPTGALGALDYLGAAQLAGLDRVHYRGRKPPAAWRGTPAEQSVDLNAVREATVVFRGSAREAARQFPKNANVAATLALCTLGMDAVQVELLADPQAPGNVHEVEAKGAAGSLSLRVVNAPSPGNPKTSLITPYSVLRTVMARACAVSV